MLGSNSTRGPLTNGRGCKGSNPKGDTIDRDEPTPGPWFSHVRQLATRLGVDLRNLTNRQIVEAVWLVAGATRVASTRVPAVTDAQRWSVFWFAMGALLVTFIDHLGHLR